jgi:hypothetical protein
MTENSEKDIYGTLASLDQMVRSIDMRLRAIEKRLSMDDPNFKLDVEKLQAGETVRESDEVIKKMRDVEDNISALAQRLSSVENVANNKLTGSILSLQSELRRLSESYESLNKRLKEGSYGTRTISVGSVKIPVDVTGIVAAGAMVAAAVLIATGNLRILTEPVFPILIAVAFIFAVVVKLYLANRGEKGERAEVADDKIVIK